MKATTFLGKFFTSVYQHYHHNHPPRYHYGRSDYLPRPIYLDLPTVIDMIRTDTNKIILCLVLPAVATASILVCS